MGSAFTTTTNAAFLMPELLKAEGIDLELVMFPSLVQRMQAVASGDVDIGNGGLSATMQLATKGFPMQVLANGCDGGWMVLAQPSINSFKDLVGKKIAVQNGSIGLVSLNWKLKQEGVFGKVEMAFMDNQDQPIPLMRGDVARDLRASSPMRRSPSRTAGASGCGCRTTRRWARPTWASSPRRSS